MTKIFRILAILSITLSFSTAAMADAKSDARAACKQDVHTLCKGIQPGGGRIIQCLKDHSDQLSDGCKSALKQAAAQRKEQNAGSSDKHQDNSAPSN